MFYFFQKPLIRKQTSLRSIRRELKSLSRKINKRIEELETEQKLNNVIRDAPGSEEPREKSERPAPNRESSIYSAQLQEGDGNLMVFCEPTGALKTTYCKQVGNNNLMINLKMISNRCQIINEEGKVMAVDSNGERKQERSILPQFV